MSCAMSPWHRGAARSPKPRQKANCRSRAKENILGKTVVYARLRKAAGGQKKPLFTLYPAKISARAVPGKHLLTIAT